MVAVGLFLNGLAGPTHDVNQFSLRQAVTPAHLQGRTASVPRVIIRGTIPVGALLGGALATLAGPRAVMWFALLGPVHRWRGCWSGFHPSARSTGCQSPNWMRSHAC